MITANQITLARIASVPFIALAICFDGKVWAGIALILFVLAALSDWFDGYLARKTGETTIFGRVFDSIADKLLIGACILALGYSGHLGHGLIIPALAILLREIFIAGLREFVLRLDAENPSDDEEVSAATQNSMGVTDLAKLKTVTQMVAVGILITTPHLFHPYLGMLGGLLFWISAVLSIYTGWQYWLEARPSFIKAGLSNTH